MYYRVAQHVVVKIFQGSPLFFSLSNMVLSLLFLSRLWHAVNHIWMQFSSPALFKRDFLSRHTRKRTIKMLQFDRQEYSSSTIILQSILQQSHSNRNWCEVLFTIISRPVLLLDSLLCISRQLLIILQCQNEHIKAAQISPSSKLEIWR